jgi:ornithine carbamoyltransferase
MLMKKDFLTLDDIKREELLEILELAEKLKRDRFGRQFENKVFGMIFEKPSTRTRISFEAGISHLGGYPMYIDASTTQLARGEPVEDVARVLDRYLDCLIARVFKHRTLEIIAKYTHFPVINALSDLSHPCQILADLLTIKEKFGRLEGLKLAYIGDGNNVCNSLLLGCAKAGIDISVGCPADFRPDESMLSLAEKYSETTGSKVSVTEDPKEAARDADVIYNDTFISMGDEKEREKRLNTFLPKYQVNKELFSVAKPQAVYMHCLPAHKGEEVAADIIEGERSIVWDQAENRMHTQKALLIKLLGIE